MRYVVDHHGPRDVERIALGAGLSVADVLAGSGWISIEAFERILAQARALIGDDARFVEACAYKVDAISGPIKFMLSAVSPVGAYEAGARNMRLVSAISTFEPEIVARGHLKIRYRTTKPESRLMCLSRQAQITRLPTVWGLPSAHLQEHSCVARGDECCLYEVRVYESRRWLPIALGALFGALLGVTLQPGVGLHVAWGWVALFGAAVGFAVEMRQNTLSNRRTQVEINEAYLQTAREEASARKELFAVAERQKTWGHLIENQLIGRDVALQQVARELELLHSGRPLRLYGDATEIENAETHLSAIEEQVGIIDRELDALRRIASPPSSSTSPPSDSRSHPSLTSSGIGSADWFTIAR